MFEILEKLKKIVENPETSIPSYGGTGAINQSSVITGNDNNTSVYSGYSDDNT
jgi:hypothetical protein